MSNTFLKVNIEKKKCPQNFDFTKKHSIWGVPTHTDVIEFSNFLLQLKNQTSGSKPVCDFSIIFILKRIMTF